MEIESLAWITDDETALRLHQELHKLGGGVMEWWWIDSPESGTVRSAVLPDDPEQAAHCRELIHQRREQP